MKAAPCGQGRLEEATFCARVRDGGETLSQRWFLPLPASNRLRRSYDQVLPGVFGHAERRKGEGRGGYRLRPDTRPDSFRSAWTGSSTRTKSTFDRYESLLLRGVDGHRPNNQGSAHEGNSHAKRSLQRHGPHKGDRLLKDRLRVLLDTTRPQRRRRGRRGKRTTTRNWGDLDSQIVFWLLK